MQKYSDTIQDRNGNVIGGCTVTVTDYPGGATSTTYATDAIGSNTNPITADADGGFSFYAKDGSYTLTVTKSGITQATKVITLRDVDDAVSVKGYGAAGDGATNDTSAIHAALLANDAVYFPPGTYLVTNILMQQDGNVIYGDGVSSIITSATSGIVIDFNGKDNCAVKDVKITSSTAATGIDCGDIAHYFNVEGVVIDGQVAGTPTGFTNAAIQIERSYYGSITKCDIAYAIRGIYGFRECNGNFITHNSIRQCRTGITISDATSNSDGTIIAFNEIESSDASSRYAIELLGTDSMVITGNRLEFTNGTAHIFVNSSTGTANYNCFTDNVLEGTIAAIILGDASGSSQVNSTMITGGRAAGNVTINSDCANTVFTAAASSYGGSLTDNGYGSVVNIDPSNSKCYIKTTASNSVKGYDLLVGGAATSLDTGTNYFDVKGTVGVHTRFETSGLLRAAQGSVAAGGDSGGTASCNTLSSVSDLTANSSGVGTILFKGTTSRNSSGFIKIYVGTTAYYVPVFSAITG